MDEQAEFEKRDTWIEEKLLSICKHDRQLLGESALRSFFEVAYWRDRYFELLLEKEGKSLTDTE